MARSNRKKINDSWSDLINQLRLEELVGCCRETSLILINVSIKKEILRAWPIA